MGYYDQKENIDEYIKISKGYSAAPLVEILKTYLKSGATLLELGMGEGKDLDLLSEEFNVTGSDKSLAFTDRYRSSRPDIPVLELDALNIETSETFDAIFSNKVLHHLYKKELKLSIQNQADRLNKDGIVAHSFWSGDKEDDYLDLHFVYYKLETIRAYFEKHFDILYLEYYKEDESDDSIYIIGKKRN